MGNCCGSETLTTDDEDKHISTSGQPNERQYMSASREAMAAAAERRAAEQQSRGAKGVVNLKARTAELPENSNSGLRWQLG